MRGKGRDGRGAQTIDEVRRKLQGVRLTRAFVAARGIDPRDKGKWGKANERLLGIAANNLPLPDLGVHGELKTTVRDSSGSFRESLRICMLGHDPLVKLRRMVLVVARDLNDERRFERREVINEDVLLLEPGDVVKSALRADQELLRSDPRAEGTYFLETRTAGPKGAQTRAYYLKHSRLQEYVDDVVRATGFRRARDALADARITATDLDRAGYSQRDKGRFAKLLRGRVEPALREGLRTGVVDAQGNAKEDLLVCSKESDPILALRRLLWVKTMELHASRAREREGRKVVDVVYLAPTPLILYVLENDKRLVRSGRGAAALFLRLKSHAFTGQKGLSWYLKARTLKLYAAVLQNQPV
jgi:hypothetical protein